MTIYTTRLKTHMYILISTFLCLLFLIPHALIAQNNKRPQPRDSAVKTADTLLNTVVNSGGSLNIDPNFRSSGQNDYFGWTVIGPGRINIQNFSPKYAGVPFFYEGFDPTTGDSYISVGEKGFDPSTGRPLFFSYNAKARGGKLSPYDRLPDNLVNKPEKRQFSTRQQNTIITGKNIPENDDNSGYQDATISKEGNIYILTLSNGSKHKVFRPLVKQEAVDTTAQKKAYEIGGLNSGPWVEIPATGGNVKMFIFDNEPTPGNKGKVSIDETITKQQFKMIYANGNNPNK